MQQVSVIDAKNNLSALIRNLENGQADSYIIARHKTPIAKLTHYSKPAASKRVGVAKADQLYDDSWDSDQFNAEISQMFDAGIGAE
jgi:antitoxin (DNA-binding transcriptional repressor) of toxin-antitoxin stability system